MKDVNGGPERLLLQNGIKSTLPTGRVMAALCSIPKTTRKRRPTFGFFGSPEFLRREKASSVFEDAVYGESCAAFP